MKRLTATILVVTAVACGMLGAAGAASASGWTSVSIDGARW